MTAPRLIATDLDGTFLRPDGTVSALNARAVEKAAERGIPFVVATGRPSRWLGVLDAVARAHPQVIVSNGGAVVDLATRTPILEFPLVTALTIGVLDELRQQIPGMTYGFETGVGFGCEPDSPSRQRQEPGHFVGSVDELIAALGPIIKVLGFHPGIDSERLTAQAAPIIGERLTLTHASVSQPYGMIELTAPGISKASTLAKVCADLHVDAADVIAFGDMPNDADMLDWVGQGFVVANGHHTMKTRGYTEVASNAEDGVGRTILDLLS